MNLRPCAVAYGILFFAAAVGACDKNELSKKLTLSSDKSQSGPQTPNGTKKLPSDLPELDRKGPNSPTKNNQKEARRPGEQTGAKDPSAQKRGSKSEKPGDPEAKQRAQKGKKAKARQKKGTVEVDKRGNTFSPPVSVERLPDGAWYCDMGKVPWAAMIEPAGGCPFPGATLRHKSSNKE
jgi:hypothetical protein